MNEQMLEQLRERQRMLNRIDELNNYLGRSDTPRKYTYEEVMKMLNHILRGGGWL